MSSHSTPWFLQSGPLELGGAFRGILPPSSVGPPTDFELADLRPHQLPINPSSSLITQVAFVFSSLKPHIRDNFADKAIL